MSSSKGLLYGFLTGASGIGEDNFDFALLDNGLLVVLTMRLDTKCQVITDQRS